MWPQFPKNIYIVPCQPIARACGASHLASFQKKIKNISFVPWSSYKSLKWLNTCIKVNSYNANRCLASTVSVLIRHYWEFSFVQWAPCLSRTKKKWWFFFHARPPMKVDSSACLMESRPWLAIPNSHACMQKLLLNLNAPLASCSCIYACNAPTNCPIGSLCCVHRDRAIHHTRRHSSRPGVGPAALLQSAVEGGQVF